jgi:hypothetical protein
MLVGRNHNTDEGEYGEAPGKPSSKEQPLWLTLLVQVGLMGITVGVLVYMLSYSEAECPA